MNQAEAISKMRDILRRKHLALSTEHSYCGWMVRYCEYLQIKQLFGSSENKIEQFLTHLAIKNVSASTQNQALNAIVFFYENVVGQKIIGLDALRAKRPVHLRHAPSTQEVGDLIRFIQKTNDFSISLVVRILYGCGLRVTEPLNLRIRDVQIPDGKFIIRGAKGGQDRMVSIPCSIIADLNEQIETAQSIWRKDQLNKIPTALPNLLSKKYPHYQFNLQWEWIFPANGVCRHPITNEIVRWRLHEANIQRAIRTACRKLNISILPHELRHAYATHCLNGGQNPRAIQQAMGHKNLETTMGYLHAEAMSVKSPLELLPS